MSALAPHTDASAPAVDGRRAARAAGFLAAWLSLEGGRFDVLAGDLYLRNEEGLSPGLRTALMLGTEGVLRCVGFGVPVRVGPGARAVGLGWPSVEVS
jgi:hypothetical protein